MPGFIPAPQGLLSVEALDYAHHGQGETTVLLPDRNLVSDMARIARCGGLDPVTPSSLTAARLMAFCQAMDLLIEPSIAYHELADRLGNAAAHAELAWFRTADAGPAGPWIDLALERTRTLSVEPRAPPTMEDLAFPLRRWRRNYVVALKIAELELADLSPLQRAQALLTWMFDDFILAGPAAVFATLYFAPGARRRGMIKALRSPDRDRAIAGVRNAAWDMTALSDFVQRVNEGAAEGRRYIFASQDRALVRVAPLLLLGPDDVGGLPSLTNRLRAWWPPAYAEAIADQLFTIVRRIERGERQETLAGPPDLVDRLIREGEARLLKPTSDPRPEGTVPGL